MLMKQRRTWPLDLAVLAAACGLGVGLWRYWETAHRLNAPLPPVRMLSDTLTLLPTEHSIGSASSKITVIEYSDFQCPACTAFALDLLPEIERRDISTGRIRLVFRSMPLEELHPKALEAALNAECAAQQGQFWPAHDWLFAHRREIGDAGVVGMPEVLHLDRPTLTACIAGDAKDGVRRTEDDASFLGVEGTPTFFVGPTPQGNVFHPTKAFSGVSSVSAFEAAVVGGAAGPPAEDR
jgi:protein-disulfide isomerase